MTDMARQIAALRELPALDLATRYREVWGREPRTLNRQWLFKQVAWRIQELAHGGLSTVATRRLDALIAEIDPEAERDARTVSSALTRRRRPTDPAVGTTLVRAWRGTEVHVRVLEDGYEHDGVVYRSLTAVAEAITGAHWSGPRFFGLRKRAEAP